MWYAYGYSARLRAVFVNMPEVLRHRVPSLNINLLYHCYRMPQKSLPDGTRCDRVAIKDDTLLEKIRTATTQLYMRHDVPQQSAIAKADDMYMFP